jgi:hypothetical protein
MNNNVYISRNKIIIFNDNFNEPLNKYIDVINNHNTVFFGKMFNKDISILPPNISTIVFCPNSLFNQEIKDFPYNLKKILFGNKFTKFLGYLPESFEELEFYPHSEFNSDLSNLPKSTKKITLGIYYSKELNCLPSELEYLKLSETYLEEFKVFPQKLKHLYFDKRYSGDNKSTYNHEITNLPDSLIEISYPSKYKYPITNLPKSLRILKIDEDYEYIEHIKKEYPNVKIYHNQIKF